MHASYACLSTTSPGRTQLSDGGVSRKEVQISMSLFGQVWGNVHERLVDRAVRTSPILFSVDQKQAAAPAVSTC